EPVRSALAAPEATMAARTVQLGASEPARRPLLVTADTDLLDDVLRISAEIGVILDVAPDPAAARRWYASAPLVLVGLDAAEACVRARLGRRPSVVLVGRYADASPPDWPAAEELGVEHLVTLPIGESWLSDRLRALNSASPPGHVVAVLGGRGGAGASVF